jgi:tRNA-splicing ligase RtcB (3'-phosphate/5'-hydroxy nucleic acid ligase)
MKKTNKQRSFQDEAKYIRKASKCRYVIEKGFVENMNVEATFYVNETLKPLMMEELKQFTSAAGFGGFLPAVKQIANVAALPGIVHRSIGLPDIHSGCVFALNV